MAITHFLLQSNSIHSNHYLQQTHNSNAQRRNYSPYNIVPTTPKMSMKCSILNHKTVWEKGISSKDLKTVAATRSDDINEVIKNVIKAIQKPVIITGVVLLALLFSYHPCHRYHALAASGGATGGSSSSSSSSSSSDSSSDSSSSYYDYSSLYDDDDYSTKSSTKTPTRGFWIFVALFITSGMFLSIDKTSVLKLQVGLLGSARSIQKDFNQIAKTADTSGPNGYAYILQESTKSLLRHPDYCISGYSSVDEEWSEEAGQERFDKLTREERDKFDKVTLSNVDNIRKESSTTQISNGVCSEYIVVTIIVKASGEHKLPPITSRAQLKKALHKLASIPSSEIEGTMLLWTPQMENDILSKEEVLKDYPLLCYW